MGNNLQKKFDVGGGRRMQRVSWTEIRTNLDGIKLN